MKCTFSLLHDFCFLFRQDIYPPLHDEYEKICIIMTVLITWYNKLIKFYYLIIHRYDITVIMNIINLISTLRADIYISQTNSKVAIGSLPSSIPRAQR